MIPFVERNYNLIELGNQRAPASRISISGFSPHGMLISGGECRREALCDNANKQIGFAGYWDTVAFDEFAGKAKKADKALVDTHEELHGQQDSARHHVTGRGIHGVRGQHRTTPYMLKNPTCSRSCRVQ